MQCEGWTRKGGAFSFGPVQWSQCEREAVVLLTVIQEGREQTLPSCMECWQKAIHHRITILSSRPIPTP